jgi:hypothetical protein
LDAATARLLCDIVQIPKSHNSKIKETLMLKEFRDFIMRGNVLDLAVAVIIGVAFGAVVTSFVNDILMPPIGMSHRAFSACSSPGWPDLPIAGRCPGSGILL